MKTITDLKEYIDVFEKSQLTSLEIETEGLRLKMTKADAKPLSISHSEASATTTETIQGLTVRSPLVGTYYASSSPDAHPFVTTGDHVTKGTTLCIIEAMKTMNEIKAPINGKIRKIHVKNGEAVGFDQVLVTIENDA